MLIISFNFSLSFSYFFFNLSVRTARNYVRAVSPYFQSINTGQSISSNSRQNSLQISPDLNNADLIINNLGIGNINNFDSMNNLNNFDNINNLNNLNEIDNTEVVKQIININENLVETVNNVISVSGLELSDKLNSFFHIDIASFFQNLN